MTPADSQGRPRAAGTGDTWVGHMAPIRGRGRLGGASEADGRPWEVPGGPDRPQPQPTGPAGPRGHIPPDLAAGRPPRVAADRPCTCTIRPTHRPGVYPAAPHRPGCPPGPIGRAWGGWFTSQHAP